MKKRIVIHCSAGPQTQKGADILSYHTRPTQQGGRGWRRAGYHYVVEADGTICQLVDENEIANGARGYNADSLHICYTGGIDSRGRGIDNRTPAQKASLKRLIGELRGRHGELPVMGHRDLSADLNGNGRIDPWERIKECPSFDAIPEYN